MVHERNKSTLTFSFVDDARADGKGGETVILTRFPSRNFDELAQHTVRRSFDEKLLVFIHEGGGEFADVQYLHEELQIQRGQGGIQRA